MIPFAIAVLLSISTFILGFEAGKNVGYNQAKQTMIALITAVMAINEKEKNNE